MTRIDEAAFNANAANNERKLGPDGDLIYIAPEKASSDWCHLAGQSADRLGRRRIPLSSTTLSSTS
jgi:hypothetical protein